MLKLNVQNKTDDEKIVNIFKSKLKKNLDISHEDLEAYVTDSVKQTIHHWKCLKTLEKYRKVTKHDCSISCSFCFQKFHENQYKRQLPCRHYFHKKCIDKWIFQLNHDNCPICNESVFKCTNF